MTLAWPGLPILVRLAGIAVVLVGEGEAADAKRRLLERAGAIVVGEDGVPAPLDTNADMRHPLDPLASSKAEKPDLAPRLAIVVDDEPAVARLKARGLLVNVVDQPELCDFTLPAIVDRAPVLVAVATGGVSAGLAAALRQRLEAVLPAGIGRLAEALHAARAALRVRYPDTGERRRAIGAALAPGGTLDPLGAAPADVLAALAAAPAPRVERIRLSSADPDELTLRQARWLAQADRVTHRAGVPPAVLDRARADAVRLETAACPDDKVAGLSVDVEWA